MKQRPEGSDEMMDYALTEVERLAHKLTDECLAPIVNDFHYVSDPVERKKFFAVHSAMGIGPSLLSCVRLARGALEHTEGWWICAKGHVFVYGDKTYHIKESEKDSSGYCIPTGCEYDTGNGDIRRSPERCNHGVFLGGPYKTKAEAQLILVQMNCATIMDMETMHKVFGDVV